jgi:hypothetical protein
MPKTAERAKRNSSRRNRTPASLRPPHNASMTVVISSLDAGIQKARDDLTVKQTFIAQIQQDMVILAALGIVAAHKVLSASDTILYYTSPVLDPEKLLFEPYWSSHDCRN